MFQHNFKWKKLNKLPRALQCNIMLFVVMSKKMQKNAMYFWGYIWSLRATQEAACSGNNILFLKLGGSV